MLRLKRRGAINLITLQLQLSGKELLIKSVEWRSCGSVGKGRGDERGVSSAFELSSPLHHADTLFP